MQVFKFKFVKMVFFNRITRKEECSFKKIAYLCMCVNR